MKDIFVSFRNEIDLTLKSLAEQDFKKAVSHLSNLQYKLNYIIDYNETTENTENTEKTTHISRKF